MSNVNEIGGYPVELFLREPAVDFCCGICLNVLKDPHQCKNGHTYCFDCISEALTARNVCPSCSVHLNLHSLSKSLVLRNLIDKLIVRGVPTTLVIGQDL